MRVTCNHGNATPPHPNQRMCRCSLLCSVPMSAVESRSYVDYNVKILYPSRATFRRNCAHKLFHSGEYGMQN